MYIRQKGTPGVGSGHTRNKNEYHNDREGHHKIQKPEINVLEAVAPS